ncbi:SDR family oxidoreductase [Thermoleophilia bacterium SCSIO 60948]|nr:SDR family oxidoreductase [Thermoleophilia bacterium SCSIO 60948]
MPRRPWPLAGRTVAVTGGARGIGRATAAAFLQRGARVAIGDIDAGLAERTAAELGAGAVGLDLDVTDRSSFAAFLDGAERQLGPLAVLVNNAGIMPLAALVDERDEIARRQVDINVHGVLLGTKLALPGMVRRGDGHIVNIASAAGKAGFPGGATYCATKHAVVGLSEAVRAETRGTGVELSVVMPSVVNTELGSGLQRTRGVAMVEPRDVAEAIVDAVQHRRFDVYVPRSLGPLFKVMTVLPRPARELLSHALKGDQVLAKPDSAVRHAYEARAAEIPSGRATAPEPETSQSVTAA